MLQPKLTKNAAVQHCFHALIRGIMLNCVHRGE